MKELLRRYLDPDPADGGGASFDSIVDKASHDSTPASDITPTPEEAKPVVTKFPWGNDDRRKTAQEIKDEQEIELGYEEEKEGKKVPAKYSIKHIKEQAKWLNDNKNLIRAAVGMNKEFTANPELSKAFTAFWAKSYGPDGKVNVEYVQKLNTMLEGKAEVIADKIDDKTDDIKDMEELLKELDPDSPQAKIMKSNINGLKATRAQLAEALKGNKSMQEKLDGLDKFKGNFEETQKKQASEAEEKRASELFATEFSSLTSKERKDGFHIDDADDAKELERMVRDQVANLANPSQEGGSKITSDEQFTQAIQISAKAAFETISKRNERIVSQYLLKKQPPKPEGKGVSRETTPAKRDTDPFDDLIDKSSAEVFAGQ